MKTEQMFESIGYKVHKKNDELIVFEKVGYDTITYINISKPFMFVTKYKSVDMNKELPIYPEEIGAIYQQMKELGWIE